MVRRKLFEDRWMIVVFFRRALGEEALNHLDIKVAEHAFVKIHDYYGLQFLRRLQQFQVILYGIVLFQRFLFFFFQGEQFKRAEIAAFLKRDEDVEKIYVDMDRKYAFD